jgi:hypothetical protein
MSIIVVYLLSTLGCIWLTRDWFNFKTNTITVGDCMFGLFYILCVTMPFANTIVVVISVVGKLVESVQDKVVWTRK